MKSSPWQKLGTFVAISALALLVWVWADLAQPGTLETQPLELTIKLPEGLTVLKPLEAPMVRLKLSGPQREIDWLGDDIARKHDPWRPELTLAKPETGVLEIDLTDELDKGDIKSRGLKIEAISPAKIKLDIGAWKPITRPVSVNIDESRLVPGSLSFEPQSVEVLVLARDMKRAELLKLRTEQISLLDVAEDEPITEKPAILGTLRDEARSEDIRIRLLEVTHIEVKFTVVPKAELTIGTLQNVPVGVSSGRPDVFDQYAVTFTDPNEAVLRELKIKGTADAIKTITQTRPEMLVYIIITQVDVRRTQQGQTLSPHKVYLNLPKGIEIHEQPLDLTSVALKKRTP